MMMDCVQTSMKYQSLHKLRTSKQASDDTIIYDKLMKAQESHKHDHSVCKNVIAVQRKGKTRLHFHFELPSNELSTCFY